MLRVLAILAFVAAGLAVAAGIVIPFTQSPDDSQRGMSIGVGIVYGMMFAIPGGILLRLGNHLRSRAHTRR